MYLPVPANDFAASLLITPEIRQCGVHQRVVLLVRDSQQVIEFLLIDFAEVGIAVLQDEMADPVCTDWERITLAVLVLRITLSGC